MSAQGKRLYRSRKERKIAGVCGGIAELAGVDPVLVRLAWVALTFIAPPVGTIGYLACWLIVPEERPAVDKSVRPDAVAVGEPTAGSQGSGPRPILEPNGSLLGGAIFIVIGVVFLLLNLGVLDWEMFRYWRWRVVWPVVLIALGGYMLLTSLRTPRRSSKG